MILRRSVLGAALAAPLVLRPSYGAGTVRLRLLETSDLHMFVLDWDYYKDRPDPAVGLASVATLIAAARAEAPNHLLFDNGDIIQGSPLGDYMLQPGAWPEGVVHPMFRAMNRLGYAAATLGNHEFNFGLPFLERALAGSAFPFVCANLDRVDSSAGAAPGTGRSYIPPSLVLDTTLRADDGIEHVLRIGIIGFVPPQIMAWDRGNLLGRVQAHDIVASAEREVPKLRATCDLVIALCHSGIDSRPMRTGDENAAYWLARVPGIDVVFTGHSHQVFPGPTYEGRDDIDAVRGTLAGKPAVMPGFWGSHLGLIDLVLTQTATGWTIADFKVEARPIARRDQGRLVSLAAPDPAIETAVKPEHDGTLAWTARPVGRLSAPVNSYFSMVRNDRAVGIVTEGQAWYAKRLLAGTDAAALPILSAASPFKAGGLAPDNYVDLPAGPLSLRNVADLYVFANTLVAVRMKGSGVREWLERSAGVFRQVDPGKDGPQPLLVPRVPSYNFDVIAGVTYAIDLTVPARYAPEGQLAHPDIHRVVDLRFQGRPIDLAAHFVVVTNNYRADGGGKFPGLGADADTVLRAPDGNRDAILHWVEALGTIGDAPAPSWRFASATRPLQLTFEGSPAARDHLVEAPGVRYLGEGERGFATYVLDVAAA